MKNRTRNIILLSGLALSSALSFAAFSYSFTKRLVKLALDREAPKFSVKSKNRLSGSLNLNLYSEEIKRAVDKFKRNNLKTVEITARDGERLVGHLLECKNPKRLIVAMHGWRSSWCKDFSMISDFWKDNDCSVLYAEQRGHSQSGGDYMGFGMIERYDCLDWINFMNNNSPKKLPVYLAGISMGAATVLMASGLNLPYNVCGIMADSAFTSPHEIWMHVVKNNLHLSYAVISALANDMCKKKINMSSKEYSTLDALKTNTVPVLFIHGSDDTFVPVSMTYQNYKECSAPKRLLIVPGAGHALSYMTERANYQRAVKDFWKDFDVVYD